MAGRRRDKKEEHQVSRRSRGRAKRAQVARAQQTETDLRREAWQRRRLKRRLAFACVALGLMVGFSHLLEHLDIIELLPNPVAQDLLVGYPTAGLLIVVGLILLPAESY